MDAKRERRAEPDVVLVPEPRISERRCHSVHEHVDEKMQVGLHGISACEMMWNDMMPEQAAIRGEMSKHFQTNCGSAETTRSGIIIDNGMKRHVRGWGKGRGEENYAGKK